MSDDVIAGVATALNIGDIPMSVDAVTAALVTAVVSSKVTVEAESQKPTVGDVRETCNTRVQSDAAVRSSAASSDSATAGTELETVATSSASSDMDLTRKKSSARKSRSAGDNTSAKHSMPEQGMSAFKPYIHKLIHFAYCVQNLMHVHVVGTMLQTVEFY